VGMMSLTQQVCYGVGFLGVVIAILLTFGFYDITNISDYFKFGYDLFNFYLLVSLASLTFVFCINYIFGATDTNGV
jgi:hypothetical protein